VCLHCNKEFKVYKSSKLPGLFCSNDCSRVSDYKRNKLIEWNKNFTNPFKNPEKQKLARETKIAKYGTLFANQEKRSKTNIERYGSLMPAKNSSNGIRISKVQKKLYEYFKSIYNDTELEYNLKDAFTFVDIYIPSKNKIIEVYGDYWHCNPNKYNPDSFHSQLHMTAKEKWKKDKEREDKLKSLGYNLEIIWESEVYDYIK